VSASSVPKSVPKLCGADVELGNFILGVRGGDTGAVAAWALLQEIDGLPLGSGRRAWSQERPARRGGGIVSQPRLAGRGTDDVPRQPSTRGGTDDVSRQPSARRGSDDVARQLSARRGAGTASRLPAARRRSGFDPQDWGRRFLPGNGGCFYIDLDHLELCLPEVRSAYDHLACWHAMLRIARQAMAAAGETLPAGQRLEVLVNNSDGRGNSYGSHLNFLVARRTWNDLVHRRLHRLLYLASYQVSSILLGGQGKVGSENDMPAASFQISQRADFFETLIGVQTTHRRPLVNARDEALCGRSQSSKKAVARTTRSAGSGTRGDLARATTGAHARSRGDLARAATDVGSRAADDLARLHVIFYDSTLCHVATVLKVGVLQVVLAMLEAGGGSLAPILDDPLEAVVSWSHDPTLRRRARLASGRRLTAVEHQLLVLEEVKPFVDAGGCDGIVPRARDIVALWEETLQLLERRDFDALARRLDWALKLTLLERTLARRPQLDWRSPEIKHIDHLYSSLDLQDGLYWSCEAAAMTERLVEEAEIEHFIGNPPADTRARSRAMLLRALDPEAVATVDWDRIRFRDPRRRGLCTIEMPDPLDPGPVEISASPGSSHPGSARPGSADSSSTHSEGAKEHEATQAH
jgi:proteasome accessory factor A